MRSKLHIFDLDTTLWKLEQKVWIIDKNNPSIPLLKINESDFSLIKSGIFRNQNNKVRFSGKEFYLPNTLVEKLKVKIKKEDANIENLGISLQEYLDKDIINNIKFDVLLDNILHLKNKNENIYVVTSRTIKEKYTKVLNKLEDKLDEQGLKIEHFYFINETFYNQNDDDNSYKKAIIILEHLTGYKVMDGEFTLEEKEELEFAPDVNFYDGLSSNINDLNQLQDVFDKIYHNTQNESIKKDLSIKLRKGLRCNLVNVTTNEVNRFLENGIELVEPRRIKMFEGFKRFKDI